MHLPLPFSLFRSYHFFFEMLVFLLEHSLVCLPFCSIKQTHLKHGGVLACNKFISAIFRLKTAQFLVILTHFGSFGSEMALFCT